MKPYVEPELLVNLSTEIVSTAVDESYACPNCESDIDSCLCACPYCAENKICECAIGYDKATGG